MSPKNAPAVATRRHRRRLTLLWSAIVVAVVSFLIYKEQVALLYILATVSVTALLVVVAVSDLGDRRPRESAPMDDSAALGDGTTTAAATAFGTTARAARRR